MGITDFFSDLYDTMTSSLIQEVHADAPEEDKEEDSGEKGGEEKSEEGGDEVGEEGGDDEKGDDEGGEEEEEEEEEEEPEDIKPKLEEECARSAQCIGFKHHFDDCVERVTAISEDPDYKGPKEDCVEEFFHLQHCATQCAAPKLFRQLK